MTRHGWPRLLANLPRYGVKVRFPLPAYSEFMPPPRIGWRPYDKHHPAPRNPADPCAWLVSEREQVSEVQPGLEIIARKCSMPSGASIRTCRRGESARRSWTGTRTGRRNLPPCLVPCHPNGM